MIFSGVSVTSISWVSPPTKASTVRSPSRHMLPTSAILMCVGCPVSHLVHSIQKRMFVLDARRSARQSRALRICLGCGPHFTRRGDHVDESRADLFPFPGFQPAIRIDPELC